MKFGIPAETHSHETRFAVSSETVATLTPAGHHILIVQSSAVAIIPYGDDAATALL
jgi:alanine dehydrogenase